MGRDGSAFQGEAKAATARSYAQKKTSKKVCGMTPLKFAARAEILKAAIEDDETRKRLARAVTWDDCVEILAEFARDHGYLVVAP